MEAQLPTSPCSKETGSRASFADQDAGTMVAQPDSTAPNPTNTISRSMSRYRGNRRNANPSGLASPPKLPALQERHLQNLVARNLQKPDEDTIQCRSDTSPEGGLRPRRRAQSITVSRPSGERPVRDAPHCRPTEPPQVEANDTDAHRSSNQGDIIAEGIVLSRLNKAAGKGRAPPDTNPTGGRLDANGMQESAASEASRPSYGLRAYPYEEAPPLPRPAQVRQTTREKIGTFSRRMDKQAPRPQAFEHSNTKAELKRMISGPIPIETSSSSEAEQPVVAPRFDAPISAVNAGSRMVRVKYEGIEVSVPITPSSTPTDIIRSAARQMSAPIDEKSTVVLESFKQVGLERPLRNYEHIRDVLNSWDYDAQNTLVIVASPTGGKDDDLDVWNVSKSQPGETTVYLYHSQRPGHWDKRWVTLRSDGQVLVSKKSGGETSNICHLSDFDIYVPIPRYTSKKIKPPKKFCFAIKSQQKSSMFMSTANFVHFFSTSDRQLSTAWYKAVQEWRSWYLVHVMGEGKKAKDADAATTSNGTPQSVVNGPPASAHQHQSSAGPSPRTQLSPPTVSRLPSRNPTTRGVPSDQPRKLTKEPFTNAPTTHSLGPSLIQQPSTQTPSLDPFAPSSLLGRTYTKRQQAQQRSSRDNLPPPLPCSNLVQSASSTASPSTIHRGTSSTPATGSLHTARKETFSQSATPGTNVKRTSSTRRALPNPQMPKPLIDLTPQYQPPPQHTRKGRGVKPEQIPAGGLIEVATSPEVAIQIPPSREWRRPGTNGGGSRRE